MSIFTILRQPVAISFTVSLILTKVTNDRFIFYIQKIILLFNKGDLLNPENYRPIANLNHPGKIFDKLANDIQEKLACCYYLNI